MQTEGLFYGGVNARFALVFPSDFGYNNPGKLRVCRKERGKAMGYMYAAMWFIAGLVLIFRLSKENKIFYLAGGFFLVLGGWWVVDALQPAWKVFQGVPGIVLKVLTAVVLVILAVCFFKMTRAGEKNNKKGGE